MVESADPALYPTHNTLARRRGRSIVGRLMADSQTMGLGAFLRIFFGYVRPYRGKALLLLLLLGVDVAFKTGWPLSFKFLIDHAIAERNPSLLWLSLTGLLAGVLLATGCAVGRDYVYAFLCARVVHDVRTSAFNHLQQLPLEFFSRTRTGDILSRFSTDLAAVENSLSWVIASLVLNVTNVGVSTVVLMTLEWRLALLTLAGLFLCVTVPRRFGRRAAAASYEKKAAEADLASVIQENASSQPAIKAFGLELRSIGHFLRQSLDWSTVARRFYFSSNLVERTPNAIILITEVFVMGGGILLIFYGHLTLGTVVAFHALFLNLSSSVEGLTAVVPALLNSMGGVQRIEELRAEPATEPLDAADTGAPERLAFARDLAFDQVTFRYAAGTPALDRVTLEIPRGAFVAFVGGSGSGKSTALNLLLRFYDCQQGAIRLDGRDLREIPRATLRGQIGLVLQETFLFDLSVRENIRLGRPAATDAEVEAAAREADLHAAVLQLPQGYDTRAGERGSRLSGGQRQRIAIARALLRQPALLVLDEATSALDPATEEAVNTTIRRVARGRTVVAVTHRLAAITQADRIFVFDGGRVVESGRHEDLLARAGRYSDLFHKQSGFAFRRDGEMEVQPARLKRYPILKELSESILLDLAGLFVTETYPAGRVVVQQGEPGNRFYIIARGKVRVSETGPGGSDELVAVLDDGDHFGEVALLSNVPRNATVTTLVPSVLLSLRRQQFVTLLERAPQILTRLRQGRPAMGASHPPSLPSGPRA